MRVAQAEFSLTEHVRILANRTCENTFPGTDKSVIPLSIRKRIIIGSDWQPETKQGIEGKIVRFRSGRVRDRVSVRDK